jgi:hypothetical protein
VNNNPPLPFTRVSKGINIAACNRLVIDQSDTNQIQRSRLNICWNQELE